MPLLNLCRTVNPFRLLLIGLLGVYLAACSSPDDPVELPPLEPLAQQALLSPQQFIQQFQQLSAASRTQLVQPLARYWVTQGKSFRVIESLQVLSSTEATDLVAAVRKLEQRDGRQKISDYQLTSDKVLRRVARLQGQTENHSWQGGALLMGVEQCHWFFVTAAHNVLGQDGQLRTELNRFRLSLRDAEFELTGWQAPVSSQDVLAAEQDWLILTAKGPFCDWDVHENTFAERDELVVPALGMAVEMVCWHQGKHDLKPSLYREPCRLYPPHQALNHYADKSAETLGIHSCVSEPGSSGCPLVRYVGGEAQLVGIQIEGDSLTGAGISRLYTQAFRRQVQRVLGGAD